MEYKVQLNLIQLSVQVSQLVPLGLLSSFGSLYGTILKRSFYKMTTEPITIPKRTLASNRGRSPLYKLSQCYWDQPNLTDESVQDAVAPYITASYTEDTENMYMIPKESPKLSESDSSEEGGPCPCFTGPTQEGHHENLEPNL